MAPKVSLATDTARERTKTLDPQGMGLAVLTGQWGSDGPALGAPTCRLFGQVHSVWSQSGPKRSHLGCPVLTPVPPAVQLLFSPAVQRRARCGHSPGGRGHFA